MDPVLTAFRAGSLLGRVLPGAVANRVADGAGLLWSLEQHNRRDMVIRHQQRIAGRPLGGPERRRLVRSAYQSYARYWSDAFRLASMPASEVEAGFTHEGMEHVEDALASGVGPVLALPHLGGWEWAAAWLTKVRGYEVAAVVERLDSDEVFDWFAEFRESLGMRIIPLGPAAGPAITKAVSSGQIACLLCDRDIGGGGIEVEFFGERTTLPGGPATIALRTGAPLLPAAVYLTANGVHGVIQAPLDTERRGRLRADVERVTQELAYALEDLIRRAPEQWHLMQPNWPSDRPSR